MLVLLVVVSGCRTYGGYDTEELTLEQIHVAIEQFEDELARAEAEANVLLAAASGNPAVAVLAEDYQRALLLHQALLERHRALAADLEDFSLFQRINQIRYRALNRVYGAIVAEQQEMRDRYAQVYDRVAYVVGRSYQDEVDAQRHARYYVVPPQYERMKQLPHPSMRNLLAR